MHVVVVFMEAERGHEVDVREALIEYSRTCMEREEGCHRYDVAIDPVEAPPFFFIRSMTTRPRISLTASCRTMRSSALSPTHGPAPAGC